MFVEGFSSSVKKSGIRVGDVIIAVNGNKVTSAENLIEQIRKYQVGDKVKVKVDRNGAKKEFTIELQKAQDKKNV